MLLRLITVTKQMPPNSSTVRSLPIQLPIPIPETVQFTDGRHMPISTVPSFWVIRDPPMMFTWGSPRTVICHMSSTVFMVRSLRPQTQPLIPEDSRTVITQPFIRSSETTPFTRIPGVSSLLTFWIRVLHPGAERFILKSSSPVISIPQTITIISKCTGILMEKDTSVLCMDCWLHFLPQITETMARKLTSAMMMAIPGIQMKLVRKNLQKAILTMATAQRFPGKTCSY